MAPIPQLLRFKNLLFLSFLFTSALLTSSFRSLQQPQISLSRRHLLAKTDTSNNDDAVSLSSPKPKKTPPPSKNQTKLIKPSSNSSKKNQTKLIKATSTPITSSKNVGAPPKLTKLKLNSTKPSDLSKNKTKSSPTPITKRPLSDNAHKVEQTQKQKEKKVQKTPTPPTWMTQYQYDSDEDYDFIAEFRDLPTKFHKTLIPDLHRLSATSKIYLTKANKEITKTFIKPYVSKQYASSASTAISFAFIVLPLLVISLIFNRITAYFSIQRLLIFIQIYLSIYFSILSLSSLITGLEPLRFFYATSQSTYVWLQVLQTLGYVMYLLIVLMYLILVFSTESGLGPKFLGLAQTFVGLAVGLHYYLTVFHRVVLHEPPKTNWKVHGIYATCFLVICLFARAERRKKAYLDEEGGEQGKQN